MSSEEGDEVPPASEEVSEAPPTAAPGAPPKQSWEYVPDELPKRKHAWDRNEAGFIEVDGVKVGKCPHNIMQEAKELLNTGLEESPEKGWSRKHPKRIYNIHKGVVYAATPTQHGKSYHGFPELPRRVSPAMKKRLLALAQTLGCETEIKQWLKG